MNKLFFASAIIVLFSIDLFGLKPFIPTESFIIDGKNWKVSRSDNMSLQKENQRMIFKLNENTETSPASLDLFLDFDSAIRNIPNYRVITSRFELNKYQCVNGNYSGKFYLPDHYISLLPLSTSIFTPGNNPGSFTIEFWLYFYKNYDNQYVIRYIGNNLSDENDKNIYGISVYTKNNRISYKFDNFFWTDKNEAVSAEIQEDEAIQPYKWEHHAVTFNIMNGKLTTYKNGIEQETFWITLDGKNLSPILSPMIKEELSTPILIGQNGSFSMDNLKITRDARDHFYLKKFNNKESVVVTDIYKLSDNNITIRKISFDFANPEYSFLKLAYRISDQYFLPDNKDLKWIYVQNNIENFPADFQDGKYIQFKMTAYPYADQDREIVINSIKLDYNTDTSPYLPVIAGIQPLDEKALITWIPTPEDDIIGYEIYYGNLSENYICSDANEGKSPVLVPVSQTGKIVPMTFTLTGLVNERPYFISIRSLDKKGHRSPFSKEFYVRPSTVYNPNRYSVDR